MSSCRVLDKPALVVAYRKAQLGSVGKACMRGVGRVGTRAWTQGQQHEPKGLSVGVAYRQEAIVIPPPRLTRTPTHLHTHHTGSHYEQAASPPAQPGASCLVMSSDAAPINGNGGKEDGGGGGGEVDTATEVPTLQLPLLLTATVVKGFGRGSKLLGIPTGKF